MNNLKQLLSQRKLEINELILQLENEENTTIKIKPTFPTLKATLFLLYYNLIESIIYSFFEILFDKIAENCNDYNMLNSKLKKQYNNYNIKHHLSNNELINLSFKKYCELITVFSGNLDARAIREILCKWGIDDDFHTDGEEKLKIIKDYRNSLAHGERAFKEVGRNYTIREIKEYYFVVDNYLTSIILIFNDYLGRKKYLI